MTQKELDDAKTIHAAYLRAYAKARAGAPLDNRDFQDAHGNEHSYAEKAAMALGVFDAKEQRGEPAGLLILRARVAALVDFGAK